MADAAIVASTSSFPFGGTQAEHNTMPKRKTPSELRGEHLKRRSFELPADRKLASLSACDRLPNGAADTVKKLDLSKNPKYIDMRLNDLFPVKKSSTTCRGAHVQEKPKVLLNHGKASDLGLSGHLHKTSAVSVCSIAEENKGPSDKNGKFDDLKILAPCPKPRCNDGPQNIKGGVQSTFLSVSQLSNRKAMSFDRASIDMDKALKGLSAQDFPGTTGDSSNMSGACSFLPTGKIPSEYQISGCKTPLDFTLKSTMRLVLSSSVKWLHRLMSCGTWCAVGDLDSPTDIIEKKIQMKVDLTTVSMKIVRKSLQSWKYPQTSLPSSIVSSMSLSSSTSELNFLKKRQQDWEDSFHNIYYMLRKKKCGAFYVLTSQFVVLFVSNLSVSKRDNCNAYISQSTNGLRSVLAENDISFSMPLCPSRVEQANADDLVELSEIEKRNLGQAEHFDSFLDVDNSPQSLLAFLGNQRVHALFDFLLNYRSFLKSLSSFDVPVLYSPVPFHNASICSPEVRCKEMKRAEFLASSGSDTDDSEQFSNTRATSICQSIEIKDDILPPWVVSGFCTAIASQSSDFEASFTLEPKSAGLNIALDSLHQKHNPAVADGGAFGVEAITVPWLRSAYLQHLKFSQGSYTACVKQL